MSLKDTTHWFSENSFQWGLIIDYLDYDDDQIVVSFKKNYHEATDSHEMNIFYSFKGETIGNLRAVWSDNENPWCPFLYFDSQKFITPYVEYVYLDNKYRNLGLGQALYVYASRLLSFSGYPLSSSATQTIDSQKVWKRLEENENIPVYCDRMTFNVYGERTQKTLFYIKFEPPEVFAFFHSRKIVAN